MTAPVITADSSSGSQKESIMQFVLPEKYTMENAPKPKDSRVSLKELPARKLGVIKFSGNATEECESIAVAAMTSRKSVLIAKRPYVWLLLLNVAPVERTVYLLLLMWRASGSGFCSPVISVTQVLSVLTELLSHNVLTFVQRNQFHALHMAGGRLAKVSVGLCGPGI